MSGSPRARRSVSAERAAITGELGRGVERRAERLLAVGEADQPAGFAHDQLAGGGSRRRGSAAASPSRRSGRRRPGRARTRSSPARAADRPSLASALDRRWPPSAGPPPRSPSTSSRPSRAASLGQRRGRAARRCSHAPSPRRAHHSSAGPKSCTNAERDVGHRLAVGHRDRHARGAGSPRLAFSDPSIGSMITRTPSSPKSTSPRSSERAVKLMSLGRAAARAARARRSRPTGRSPACDRHRCRACRSRWPARSCWESARASARRPATARRQSPEPICVECRTGGCSSPNLCCQTWRFTLEACFPLSATPSPIGAARCSSLGPRAGTGKTRVLEARFRWLVAEGCATGTDRRF